MEDTDAAPERGIDQADVLEKYKAAGAIVDQIFQVLQKALYAGMTVSTLCQLGDTLITKECGKTFSKARTESGEKLEKGIAFPTCICINNCASHFCPIETDAESKVTLTSGDIVTIQLGAHIDGYAAIAAHTLPVRESKDSVIPPLKNRAGDVAMAAYTAADAALRVLRPGKSNEDVSDVIQRVAKDFDVLPLEGVLSHEMKRYVVDGSNVIMNKQTVESRANRFEFGNFEVYNLDVVMSTGEGKAIERNTRETVYKRQVDVDYKLKMKTSRQIFSEINKSFPTMPFTLRALSDPKKARMAMTEILKHSLVTPYPVLYERDEDALIARCSMTVLITPTQTMVVTKGLKPSIVAEKQVQDEEVQKLLATSIEKKKKKKKKSKKTGSSIEAVDGDGDRDGDRDGDADGDGDGDDMET